MISQIAKLRSLRYLRVGFALISFFIALDKSIALNRWWIPEGEFETYMTNVVLMLIGFAVFVALMSRSKTELVGYVLFCIAVYFICDYEVGGDPSKYYLTPFDPIFARARGSTVEPFFAHGPDSFKYRQGMAFGTSLLTAFVLSVSKLKRSKEVSQ